MSLKFTEKTTDSTTILYTYFEINKVFLNGESYEIQNLSKSSEKNARFVFGNYSVKLFNNRVTLYNKNDMSVYKILLKETDDNTNTTSSSTQYSKSSKESQSFDDWVVYKIYANERIGLSLSKNLVRLNDSNTDSFVYYEILDSYNIGSSILYNTEIGNLIISTVSNRDSTWNGVNIEQL